MKRASRFIAIIVLILSMIVFFQCAKDGSSPIQPPDTPPTDLVDQVKINDQFVAFLSTVPMDSAVAKAVLWARQQPYVRDVEPLPNGLAVVYTSGIHGAVLYYERDSMGLVRIAGGDPESTSSGPPSDQKRAPVHVISSPQTLVSASNPDDNESIGSKKILLWSPCEFQFGDGMRQQLNEVINDSPIGLEFITLIDQYCTVSAFTACTQYGIIILNTHGSRGKYFMSGERVTNENMARYVALVAAGKLETWTITTKGFGARPDTTENFFAIGYQFVGDVPGVFPKTVVFNGSCGSTSSAELEGAFMQKNARTYFGFDKVTTTTFTARTVTQLMIGLAGAWANTGQAFIPNQTDPHSQHARFEMKGSAEMAFKRPAWEGTFHYSKIINKEFVGADETTTFDVDISVDLPMILNDTGTMPILFYPLVYSNYEIRGPYILHHRTETTSPYGTNTCTADCSDTTTVLPMLGVSWLEIQPDSGTYKLVVTFIVNKPCTSHCSSGSSHELPDLSFIGHPADWPTDIPYPLKGQIVNGNINGSWNGPDPAEPGDCSTLDAIHGAKLSWSFRKVE